MIPDTVPSPATIPDTIAAPPAKHPWRGLPHRLAEARSGDAPRRFTPRARPALPSHRAEFNATRPDPATLAPRRAGIGRARLIKRVLISQAQDAHLTKRTQKSRAEPTTRHPPRSRHALSGRPTIRQPVGRGPTPRRDGRAERANSASPNQPYGPPHSTPPNPPSENTNKTPYTLARWRLEPARSAKPMRALANTPCNVAPVEMPPRFKRHAIPGHRRRHPAQPPQTKAPTKPHTPSRGGASDRPGQHGRCGLRPTRHATWCRWTARRLPSDTQNRATGVAAPHPYRGPTATPVRLWQPTGACRSAPTLLAARRFRPGRRLPSWRWAGPRRAETLPQNARIAFRRINPIDRRAASRPTRPRKCADKTPYTVARCRVRRVRVAPRVNAPANTPCNVVPVDKPAPRRRPPHRRSTTSLCPMRRDQTTCPALVLMPARSFPSACRQSARRPREPASTARSRGMHEPRFSESTPWTVAQLRARPDRTSALTKSPCTVAR